LHRLLRQLLLLLPLLLHLLLVKLQGGACDAGKGGRRE
jgi:hypothetical protein